MIGEGEKSAPVRPKGRTRERSGGVNYAPLGFDKFDIWILPVTLWTGVFQQRGGFTLKKIHGALIGSALALPLSIGAALAADPMASDNKIACTEVKYSAEFLDKYPQAPAACLEAVEKEGKRYAKFNAKVFLNSADRTTVQLLNVKGDPLTTFSFKPGPDAGVNIDGKKTKFTDLKVGEQISFWVSEDRLTASELPGSTDESWAVLPPQ